MCASLCVIALRYWHSCHRRVKSAEKSFHLLHFHTFQKQELKVKYEQKECIKNVTE